MLTINWAGCESRVETTRTQMLLTVLSWWYEQQWIFFYRQSISRWWVSQVFQLWTSSFN